LGSSSSIVTNLRTGRQGFDPGRGNDETPFLRHRLQTSSGYQGFFPRGVNITTDRHLVPKLRKRGAVPPLLRYIFMAWCLFKHRENFTFIWRLCRSEFCGYKI